MPSHIETHNVSSSPVSVTNDIDNGRSHLYIVALASGTVNLPSAGGFRDAVIAIKKRNASAGTITIQPALSQTINGASTYSLTSDNQYVQLVSDNANWHIIANN